MQVSVEGGRLSILREGRVRKFRAAVREKTFAGASAGGRPVLYVTERAVFRLRACEGERLSCGAAAADFQPAAARPPLATAAWWLAVRPTERSPLPCPAASRRRPPSAGVGGGGPGGGCGSGHPGLDGLPSPGVAHAAAHARRLLCALSGPALRPQRARPAVARRQRRAPGVRTRRHPCAAAAVCLRGLSWHLHFRNVYLSCAPPVGSCALPAGASSGLCILGMCTCPVPHQLDPVLYQPAPLLEFVFEKFVPCSTSPSDAAANDRPELRGGTRAFPRATATARTAATPPPGPALRPPNNTRCACPLRPGRPTPPPRRLARAPPRQPVPPCRRRTATPGERTCPGTEPPPSFQPRPTPPCTSGAAP
jgi:hypothetical protein